MSTLNGRNLNKNADAETAGNFQLQGEQYPLLPTLFAIVNAWVRSCCSAGDAESYFVNQKAVLAKCIPGFSTDPGYSQESFYRLLSAVRLKELLYYVTAYGADLAAPELIDPYDPPCVPSELQSCSILLPPER